ncbi:MAG: DNA recombination protein RmuC [Xanthomonadales bacterium]|jgi:DNA recombination protein RmuC|nr:DNA recombination protein RmuC [Xanthomonadales bacterium]
MNEFFQNLDPNSLVIGALSGLLVATIAGILAWRSGVRRGQEAGAIEAAALREELDGSAQALAAVQRESAVLDEALQDAKREAAVLRTRMEEQQAHFERERGNLQETEKRWTENFERLSGRILETRSRQFSEHSEKQLETLLKPLSKDLESFRGQVEQTHKQELEQHAALRERLSQLEGLNERLNEEARNLTRALTADVKAQGGWGEQQLEKLLELSGLSKGEHYHTQVSVTGRNGERLQPDFVLRLPEGRAIVMDSKVSLKAWTRYQAATDDGERERHLVDHVKSLRAHIDGLSAKNYASAEDLNALDFVLMFVPIEAALIAALHQDPGLPEHALNKRVALLSPANFLATVRTVASVWMVHKQNTNARDIADRAGKLYDKFVGFTDNLKGVGMRLDQAQRAYDGALSQLSEGRGNLVRQVEDLRKLGARHQKQLDAALVEKLEDASDHPADEPSEIPGEDDADGEEKREKSSLTLVKDEDKS